MGLQRRRDTNETFKPKKDKKKNNFIKQMNKGTNGK